MAAESVKLEKLTKTKKYESMVANGDLYSLPVTAVPGCGFLLGLLLKKESIIRASDLYAVFKQKKNKEFAKYLSCKFGPWNAVYAQTVIRAFEDWEKAHVVKPEKKPKKEPEEKKKGPPRKVGPGSKKWDAFMKRTDLAKTPIRAVPGIASILGCEMEKRGFCNAKQLMDQYIGTKKSQCKGDDELFHKWILCCFGYWNTQYSKAVLIALKAHGAAHDENFWQKVARVAENAAEGVAKALDEPTVKEEAGNADEVDNEENNENQDEVVGENNENQAESFVQKAARVAERAAERVASALDERMARHDDTDTNNDTNAQQEDEAPPIEGELSETETVNDLVEEE